jgi:hypothetical protein
LFLPQRTRLVFVRNIRIGAECLHVNVRFAMLPGTVIAYDFDPTTLAENSGKTPANEKIGCGANPVMPQDF